MCNSGMQSIQKIPVLGLFIGLLLVLLLLIYVGTGFVGSSPDEGDPVLQHITNVYMWTRQSQVVAEELSVMLGSSSSGAALHNTHFSPYRTTYIITHGFLSSALYNWVIILKDALLSRQDCNVIAISWESGSSRLSYYIVQGRVPAVGAEVAGVVEQLRAHGGLNLGRLHLIGHSLGAHVSGFAGKHFNGSIARITGLDPAGMGFNGAAAADRLDMSDARFVDVVHTHGCSTLIQTYTCYGLSQSVGDVDVWVNGGEQQPACEGDGDGEQVLEDGSPCHHSLSYVYYTESLAHGPSSRRYLSRSCPTPQHYANNSCVCPLYPQYMGYNVNDRTRGDFYLNTSNTWPYGAEDPDCPPAEYTMLQTIGLVLLTVTVSVGTVVVSIVVWLHHRPQDREYLTTEVMVALLITLVDGCGALYDRYLQRRHRRQTASGQELKRDDWCTRQTGKMEMKEIQTQQRQKTTAEGKEMSEERKGEYDMTEVQDL